jgi:glyoxylase-like metal-dependent hydrolase (beta-lactamase superfamily II)
MPATGEATGAPRSIGAYVSAPKAYSTVSYWLEGSDGLVLIDTQFLPSDALKFVDAAERATGKKVLLAIVLHPNPDKFNGVAAMQQRGIRVVTSAQVAREIPAVHRIRLGWFYDEFRPDYPKDAPAPTAFGDRTTQMQVAGMTLTMHVLGPGCSAAHVVVQSGDAIFVGDLVASGTHAWLELGLVDAWLTRLDEVRALRPARVYPGRGPAGGPETIEATDRYLRFVRESVVQAKPEGDLGTLRRWALSAAIEGAYPSLSYPLFMREGLPAVWRQMQK